MKKLLATLLITLSLSASAGAEENTVWTAMGANFDAVCRTLWNEYDITYGTSSKVVTKLGASGAFAATEMLKSSDPKKFMCFGSSLLYNPTLYPDIEFSTNDVEFLIQVVRFPMVWYVPNGNKLTSLHQLVEYFRGLGRPANIGTFTATHSVIIRQIAAAYNLNINIVNYKSGAQIFPSLYDGSIDLMLDGGGAVPVAETGKFRIIGYSASSDYDSLSKYPNFLKEDKTLTQFESWMAIVVPKGQAGSEEVIKRIATIIKQPKFQKFALDSTTMPSGTVQPEIGAIALRNQTLFKKYWK